MQNNNNNIINIKLSGVLLALGIVYGDIGTSPLYVMKAIISATTIDEFLIYGSLSCVFWTLLLQTSLKYVILILNVDRKGQGGLLTLYSLIKKGRKWWIVFFAIFGASMLLSEGIVTPAISVSAAIEGLNIVYPNLKLTHIIIPIIILLFFIQKFGTNFIGRLFGPIMLVWFLSLAISGFSIIVEDLSIFQAIHPKYAMSLLLNHPDFLYILGAVFLCTTGAEALYSDMGHCKRIYIRLGWIFVKICLLLNYFGQASFILSNKELFNSGDMISPFYMMVDSQFLIFYIFIASLATIIASQALISGSFSLISEASRLGLLPKFKTKYPTNERGQIYIPVINNILFVGCIIVILHFKNSSNMEAVYGIAVITTMISTTFLYTLYLYTHKVNIFLIGFFFLFYISFESLFFAANLTKLFHGGWIIVLFGFFISFIMWICYQMRVFKMMNTEYTHLKEYIGDLVKLSSDKSVTKISNNLVYMTSSELPYEIEKKIIYSIFERMPKRADLYWFLHINFVNNPYTTKYKTTTISKKDIIRVDIDLGFKIKPRINLFVKQIMHDLIAQNKISIDNLDKYYRKQNIYGDINYVILNKYIDEEDRLNFYQKIIYYSHNLISKFSIKEDELFGLDADRDSIINETVPIEFKYDSNQNIKLQQENS